MENDPKWCACKALVQTCSDGKDLTQSSSRKRGTSRPQGCYRKACTSMVITRVGQTSCCRCPPWKGALVVLGLQLVRRYLFLAELDAVCLINPDLTTYLDITFRLDSALLR